MPNDIPSSNDIQRAITNLLKKRQIINDANVHQEFVRLFRSFIKNPFSQQCDASVSYVPVDANNSLLRIQFKHTVDNQGISEKRKLSSVLKKLDDEIAKMMPRGSSARIQFEPFKETAIPSATRFEFYAEGVVLLSKPP